MIVYSSFLLRTRKRLCGRTRLLLVALQLATSGERAAGGQLVDDALLAIFRPRRTLRIGEVEQAAELITAAGDRCLDASWCRCRCWRLR